MQKSSRLLYLIVLLCISASLSAQSYTENGINKLIEQGNQYKDTYEYTKAEDAYTQAAVLLSGIKNMNSPAYPVTLGKLGEVYYIKGKYQEADSVLNLALHIIHERHKDLAVEYAKACNDLGSLYMTTEDFTLSHKYLTEAVEIRREVFGEQHPDYAEALLDLAYLYFSMGESNEAELRLNEAKAIFSTLDNKQSIQYSKLLTVMGYVALGGKENFALAEKYLGEATETVIRVSGKHSPEYANTLMPVFSLYARMGRYKDALNLYTELNPLLIKFFGERHPWHAAVLSDLGAILLKTGHLKEAEATLLRSLSIAQETLGKNHSYYLVAQGTLAAVYTQTGATEIAKKYYTESLEGRQKKYKGNNKGVANTFNNLGTLYANNADYSKAEHYYIKALDKLSAEEQKSTTGTQILGNLVNTYLLQYTTNKLISKNFPSLDEQTTELEKKLPGFTKNFSKYNSIFNRTERNPSVLEKLFLEVLKRHEENLGRSHPTYISTLNNFGFYYFSTTRYKEAELCYQLATELITKSERNQSPEYISIIQNRAVNYEAMNRYEDAHNLYTNAVKLLQDHMKENFLNLSENERELFWEQYSSTVEQHKSFVYRYHKKYPSFTALAYNCEIFGKSLLLNSSSLIHHNITNTANPQLIEQMESIRSTRASIIEIYEKLDQAELKLMQIFSLSDTEALHEYILKSKNEDLIKGYERIIETRKKGQELEFQLQQEEKEFISGLPAYVQQADNLSMHWSDIKNSLKEDEMAIEFIRFQDFDMGKMTIFPIKYAALLLRADSPQPEMIYLCEEPQLSEALKNDGPTSGVIYNMIWGPLEQHLSHIKTIYLAPSGLINNISFAGLKSSQGYICDHYVIHRLLSTKDIVSLKKGKRTLGNKPSVALFGGADYNMPYEELAYLQKNTNKSKKQNPEKSKISHSAQTRSTGFDYLPGSLVELQTIDKLLSASGWSTMVYADTDATETGFKSLSSTHSPELIHISTHGFYLQPPLHNAFLSLMPPQNQNTFKASGHPLLRSGLAFTCANQAWNDRKKPDLTTDDGILTALEISTLNLSNTKVAILSACRTGLGDVKDSEGIFGLQRALRLAGVDSMIVSLWEVEDKETVELMTTFYSELVVLKDVKKAFTSAQNTLKKIYSENPEKWAGFVLIE